MDHRFSADLAIDFLVLETDHERAALMDRGHITGLPARTIKEEVFALVETEQDHAVKSPLFVLSEEDRVFALKLGKLCRIDRCLIDAVAIGRAKAGDHLEIRMIDIVQKCHLGHEAPFGAAYARCAVRARFRHDETILPCLQAGAKKAAASSGLS